MWERDAVTTATAALFVRVRAGHGGALFVVAEAGLGKTSALEHACQQAGEPPDRFAIGLGRGDAMEANLPFGLLAQAVEELGGWSALAPAAMATPGEELRGARFFGVLRWLEGMSADRPVLLALDDLHWADPDSLALLSFLVRRIAALPVAVVGTLRPWPPQAHDVVVTLAHQGRASVQRLDPLSQGAADALLTAHVGRELDAELLERTWQLCAGNPLLLEQAARAIGRGEQMPRRSMTPVTHVGEELLLARFAGLPADGVRCAQAGSVLGSHFRLEIAAEIAGLADDEAELAAEALWRSGLLTPGSGGDAAFVHQLFRQSLYDDLPPPMCRRLHARAYAVLGRRGLAVEAAEHAVRADLVGDDEAVAVVAQAGQAAFRVGALATAIERFEAAVCLSAARPRPGLLIALARAKLAASQPRAAAQVCSQLLGASELSSDERMVALRIFGTAQFFDGKLRAAQAAFDQAVGMALPGNTFAVRTLLDQSLMSWISGGPARALPFAERAREAARASDEPLRYRAEAAWAFLTCLTGDPSALGPATAAVEYADAELGATPLEHDWHWSVLSGFAIVATYAERFDAAERAIRALDSHLDRLGIEARSSLLASEAEVLMRTGRLQAAGDVLERALTYAELGPVGGLFALTAKAELLLLLGRLDESAEVAATVDELAGPPDDRHLAELRIWHVRGQLHLASGEPALASAMYAHIEARTRQLGIGEPCALPWARHAVWAHVAADRRDDAERVLAWLASRTDVLPCRWPRIALACGQAMLAEQDGDIDLAERAFAAALRWHGETTLPVEEVLTLRSYGSFLRRTTGSVAARPVLARALALAERVGAGWLVPVVRAELAVAGGRRRRGHEESDRLTAQEERIAELAGTGRGNAEIARQLSLSVRTVETHLGRVYTKLGIHSRRELMTPRRAAPHRVRGDSRGDTPSER